MHTEERNTQSKTVPEIKIEFPLDGAIDFNSKNIKEQFDSVKEEIKLVLDGANIDTKKLSLHFTI